MALTNTPLAKTPPAPRPGNVPRLRIVVAGQSEIVCKPILDSLKTMAGVEVVAKPTTGIMAVGRLRREHVNVVVMDIGMSEIDGLKAIPQLMQVDPDIKILMVATLTFRNVKIITDGLVAGAVEIVTLPVSRNKKSIDSKFRLELTSKIKALGRTRPRVELKTATVVQKTSKIELREPSSHRPDIIAIGSSTGPSGIGRPL